MVDRLEIQAIAEACRSGLATLRDSTHSRFRDFPSGNCGDASELVGRVLKETLDCDGQYVCGYGHPQLKPTQSHAWFEVGHVVIDITYDQFDGTGLSGWVFPSGSVWHAAFTDIERRDGYCMPTGWPMYPHDGYDAILRRIAARS